MFFTNCKLAWLPGLIVAIIAQVLIILYWKDAKYFTIINGLILFVSFVSYGGYLLHNEFKKRVKSDFATNSSLPTDLLTQKDINHLPQIVQKYLHYTKSVGKSKIKNFRAEMKGSMRSNPGDEFLKSNAVQYNFYHEPSRYFLMTAKKVGLPATGLHLYELETATFVVKMLNWIKVVDAKGKEMNQGETVTLLNDMSVFAPPTLIDKRISWEELDPLSVRVTFKNGNITVSAVLYFNEEGRLDNFISQDRYETVGKEYIRQPWSTPLKEYKTLNGYFLAGKGEAIQHRPDGDFVYIKLTILDVSYNFESFS